MDGKRSPHLIAYLAFSLALLISPVLIADPIETWRGANAQVYASGVQSSQQGSVAEASATGQTQIYYSSTNAPGDPDAWSVQARSTAKAEVLGTRDVLLQASVSHMNDNPGTRPYGSYSNTPAYASAEASWIGDRIHIAPGPNGVMPEQVRLGVMLELTNPSFEQAGTGAWSSTVSLKLGDRLIEVGGGLPRDSYGVDISSRLIQLGFDTAERATPDSPYFHAKAFMNLAIDAQGWSGPIDLSLKATAGTTLESNQMSSARLSDIKVSLDDLTLFDGTSIVDAGYRATFESGLDWPQPVPEPASLACWFALAGSAGWLTRHRSRTAD